MQSEDVVSHMLVYFEGHVQGVGFRYSTRQVSKEFEVTGFVKNLPDGRVQLEAEGEAREVEAFVKEVESRLGDYIRRTEKKRDERTRQHSTFSIAG